MALVGRSMAAQACAGAGQSILAARRRKAPVGGREVVQWRRGQRWSAVAPLLPQEMALGPK
jgi:ribosomal protein L34